MIKKMSIVAILFAFTFSIGCQSKEENKQLEKANTVVNNEEIKIEEIENIDDDIANDNKNTFETISVEMAYELINSIDEKFILDVREQEEYDEGHIEKAILMPYETIEENIETITTNKDDLILIYCRSGRRSKIAAQTLVDLGYTNVKDFGGIMDWPYDIVK